MAVCSVWYLPKTLEARLWVLYAQIILLGQARKPVNLLVA
jgi:hypothetical protein